MTPDTLTPITLVAGNFLVPNATFLAELLAFVAILWVLRKYVLPPVQKAMRDRQEMISTQVEESRRAHEQLEAAQAEFKRALGEARTEAAKIRESARADAQRIIDEAREQAEQEAERVRQRSEEQLVTQRQQVVNELRAEIGRLAVTLASRVVGESLDDGELRQRTVDRFLAELEQMAESASIEGASIEGASIEGADIEGAGSGSSDGEPASARQASGSAAAGSGPPHRGER